MVLTCKKARHRCYCSTGHQWKMDYCCAKRHGKNMYYKRVNNERKKQRGIRDAGEKKSGHLLCARNAIQRRGMYGFWERRGRIQVFIDGRGQERWSRDTDKRRVGENHGGKKNNH